MITPTLTRRQALFALSAAAQEAPSETPVEFLCPMDKDVREKGPGRCPRCGMKLLPGLPDPVEYPVQLTLSPRVPRPGHPVRLRFTILHPKTRRPVPELEVFHERPFHLFLISEDLNHFAHEHPVAVAPGVFEFVWTFAQGGLWRLLCDFFPTGATPQLIAKSILLAPTAPAPPAPAARNLEALLTLEPTQPLAGEKTLLFYQITPRENFEPYLGAEGHMLLASEDLIDLVHTHPALIDGGLASPPSSHKLLQFNLIFPRPGRYRVWAQFQRAGLVNTVASDITVHTL